MQMRKTLKQLGQMVKEWNDNHPVGSRVKVKCYSGAVIKTETTSAAWLMGGHSPMVKLAGVSGAYALERCAALVPSKK